MKTMKLVAFFTVLIGLSACSEDDKNDLKEVASVSVTNLYAPQVGGQGQPESGAFTKFDFESGEITSSETDWDIAFRGTIVLVNGGGELGLTDEPVRNGNAAAYITTGTLASVTTIESTSFVQDSSEGTAIDGWYNYNPSTHLISAITGKIIVVKTRDGRFAKLEIVSYYKDAPANPDALSDETPYYTFNYVYQPNVGVIGF